MTEINSIFLTGASGFVGSNLVDYLGGRYSLTFYKRGNPALINEDAVVHLAGKAHDMKHSADPSEYYEGNTELTKTIFDAFLSSDAKIFIMISSVKAVTDTVTGVLDEQEIPKPLTYYGKSKLLAEQYLLSRPVPDGKRVYILRPCMIYGRGNKGNLTLLFKIVHTGLPWPLGAFENYRSFCNVNNLCFIIEELIKKEDIAPGIYNVADDGFISTKELVKLISGSLNKKPLIINMPKGLVTGLAKVGDLFRLPLNSERLGKLTENYMVDNRKLKSAIRQPLPVTLRDGLTETFASFSTGL